MFPRVPRQMAGSGPGHDVETLSARPATAAARQLPDIQLRYATLLGRLGPALDGPGTLADVEALLPYVSRLGFDVLYLPPIHPIGVWVRIPTK